MLKEIRDEVYEVIITTMEQIRNQDNLSFILFIGRGDIIEGLKAQRGTNCVVDYEIDKYYDETRKGFYLRYLNRNYYQEGFHYEGTSGIDDLSIEMMIYSHLWESVYFLKSLYRLTNILTGKGYKWNVTIPEYKRHNFIVDEIINPLKQKDSKLGAIIEKGYCSIIRNAFAHALYDVDTNSKEIQTRTRQNTKIYTFEEFQKKFLYSIFLMDLLKKSSEEYHYDECLKNGAVTDVFKSPEGIDIQVFGYITGDSEKIYSEFEIKLHKNISKSQTSPSIIHQ